MNDLPHNCEPWTEPISLLAAGCLAPDEERDVRRHIETCAACHERLQQLTQLCSALPETQLPGKVAENVIVERVMSAVASEGSRRPLVRTQAEMIQSSQSTRPRNSWRWVMRSPVSRVAASVVFVMAVAGVVLWFHSGGGATPAFADYIRPILEAKTVKFKETVETKGPPPTTITSQWMMPDATQLRMEVTAPQGVTQSVTITDWSKGKSLSLIPATKHATILDYDNTKERTDPSHWIRLLQMARENKAGKYRVEPLGEKKIDGRTAVGFRMTADYGTPFELWGDPETGLPIRVEMTSGMNGNMKVIFSDFVFNAPMDKSLFSIEPPAGYTVDHQKVNTAPNKEKDLIEMFRLYTMLCDGVFPDSLDSRLVTSTYWQTYNIRAMWDNTVGSLANAFGVEVVDQRQKREFEKEMLRLAAKQDEQMMAGKMDKEQDRKYLNEMTKSMKKFLDPLVSRAVIQSTWKGFAPEAFKATAEQKRQFEDWMRKNMVGKPASKQTAESLVTVVAQMVWDNLAPADIKADKEKRREFEELMTHWSWKLTEKQQKTEERFRNLFGERMLKDVEAWQAEVARIGKAREARAQTLTKNQEAESQKFMDAQRQIGRGLDFANHLPPSADAHYVGKDVKFGAADTPIFWYRPKGSREYRVIYADLSVRVADAPPNVTKGQPSPDPSGPRE